MLLDTQTPSIIRTVIAVNANRISYSMTWADIPERYGPYTTCVNRFNRWRKAGVLGGVDPSGRPRL